LIVLALAVLAPLSMGRTDEAAAEEANGPIAAAAMRQLGTDGGQCWTFMQQVVAEATGRKVGFDYRAGYFEAGAVEVSISEAANGDIIQIAADSNSGAWASYPGLHTAIILKNLGDGRFDAIDSNQNWDEMVRMRTNYDPFASAARHGLQVHIYRIPVGNAPVAAAAPETAATFEAADVAKVAAGGDCLNLRSGASTTAARLGCLATGTQVTATGETKTAGGMTWVQVETPKGTGWVAARFLAKVAVAADAASAAAPVPEPEAAPAAEAEPAVSLAPAVPDVPAAGASAISNTARVDNSPGCLRVRGAAGTAGAIKDCLAAGTGVTIVDEAAISADGYSWVRVRVEGRVDGWVASDFLIRS